MLRRSTLVERRPVFDAAAGMLAHADLVVTARVGGLLVGVERGYDGEGVALEIRTRRPARP